MRAIYYCSTTHECKNQQVRPGCLCASTNLPLFHEEQVLYCESPRLACGPFPNVGTMLNRHISRKNPLAKSLTLLTFIRSVGAASEQIAVGLWQQQIAVVSQPPGNPQRDHGTRDQWQHKERLRMIFRPNKAPTFAAAAGFSPFAHPRERAAAQHCIQIDHRRLSRSLAQ